MVLLNQSSVDLKLLIESLFIWLLTLPMQFGEYLFLYNASMKRLMSYELWARRKPLLKALEHFGCLPT